MKRKNRVMAAVFIGISFVCVAWFTMAAASTAEPVKVAAVITAMASFTGAVAALIQALKE